MKCNNVSNGRASAMSSKPEKKVTGTPLAAAKKNAPYRAAQLGDIAEVMAAVSTERERCAMKLQVSRADVSLAAGELSAQEWRTCAAVLRWMQCRIRGA